MTNRRMRPRLSVSSTLPQLAGRSFFLVLIVSIGAAAMQPATAATVESRLAFVEKLVFESSAARKIADSGEPRAETLRRAAEQHCARARELVISKEYLSAESELNKAIRAMQDAVHAIEGSGIVSARELQEYERRRQTVEALLAAHQHISEEKGMSRQHRELAGRIGDRLESSDSLLRRGQANEARTSLDSTYQEVRSAVESLREGDTLIRELHFETDEEEYFYELDRNDTHRMLIKVLLGERLEDERLRATAEDFIENAAQLRENAEKAASNAQFASAIELMERSTQELIRAIRSAGIYVPG